MISTIILALTFMNYSFKENGSRHNEINTLKKETDTPLVSAPSFIEVYYTLSLKLDEEKFKNLPEQTLKLVKEKMGGDKTFVLKSNAKVSTCQLIDDVKFKDDIIEKEEPGKNTKKITSYEFSYSNHFKDFENQEVVEQKFFKGEVYLIESDLKEFDWAIGKETIEINGYKCKFATTTNNGKTIKAWFTEDIAIPDGPMIYHGLPGLILKIETPDREIYATKIKFSDKLDIMKFTNGKKTTKEEMDKILDEFKNRQDYEKKEGNKTETLKVIKSN